MTGRRSSDPEAVAVEESVELSSLSKDVRVYPESNTRHLLAVIVTLGMTAAMILVVLGGLIGAFDATLVGAVCAPYGTAFAAAAFFFFKGQPQRSTRGRR